MKHNWRLPAVCAALALLLAGCGRAAPAPRLEASAGSAGESIQMEAAAPSADSAPLEEPEASALDHASAEPQAPAPEPAEPAPWTDALVSATAITKVYGDGQKLAAVALEYPSPMDAASVSPADYAVADYEITGAFIHDTPELASESTEGNYVILTLNTDYILPNYSMNMGIGDPNSVSNQLSASVSQTGDVQDEIGSVFLGSDTVAHTDPAENINLVVDDFQQLVYTNPDDGSTLMYNLFLPEDTDTPLPLVLFMPDATGAGYDPVKTLTQGLGAVIWAEPDSQAEHPCYVLAPQYTNQATDYDNTLALLNDIAEHYPIDTARLYTTGQSAGTIKSIQMMIDNPTLFAGALLVAGQAENGYEDKIAQLYDQNLWMVCSTGDARANPGMTAIMEAVRAEGTAVTEGTWSFQLSAEEQTEKVKEMAAAGTSINLTILSDVVPEGVEDNAITEHLNTWRVAYSIPEIRNWIFAQSLK